MRKTTLALTVLCAIILSSCRETDTVQPNFPPEARAGEDHAISLDETVTIDASGSIDANNDSLFYTWTFVRRPASSQAVIENVDARVTRFNADAEGAYVIRLTVTDLIDSDSDTLTLLALKDNNPPETDPHAIVDITPQHGTFGSNIKINGSNFSTVQEENKVTINGMPAEVTSASHTSLVVLSRWVPVPDQSR